MLKKIVGSSTIMSSFGMLKADSYCFFRASTVLAGSGFILSCLYVILQLHFVCGFVFTLVTGGIMILQILYWQLSSAEGEDKNKYSIKGI